MTDIEGPSLAREELLALGEALSVSGVSGPRDIGDERRPSYHEARVVARLTPGKNGPDTRDPGSRRGESAAHRSETPTASARRRGACRFTCLG